MRAKELDMRTQTVRQSNDIFGRLLRVSNGTGVFIGAHSERTQINSKPKTILFSLMIYVIAVWTEGGKYVFYLCSWVFCQSGRMERGYFSLLYACENGIGLNGKRMGEKRIVGSVVHWLIHRLYPPVRYLYMNTVR